MLFCELHCIVSIYILVISISAENGRIKLTTSGVFCAVNITNALPKDNGNWKLTIGTGEHLMAFEKHAFLYPVSVKGNIRII